MTGMAIPLLADSRAFLLDDYLPKIERCLNVLDEQSVWWRANEATNSIGNLILHLDGSTRMWIIGVAGKQSVVRDRAAEFSAREPLAKSALLAQLRSTLVDVGAALETFTESTLLERRFSNQGEVTALWAVLHAVEHFAMHTGQIILLTKIRTGADLQLSG